MLKKHNFIYNLLFVSLTSVFLGALSLVFRFYLAETITSEGVGIYQLIISVYAFGATAASSGLSFTVTRFVSEALATGRENGVKNILRGVFIFALFPSLAATFFLFFFADGAATLLIGIPETAACLRILAFSFPFMAAASCFSGFFVAIRRVPFASATQISEDLFQIAVTFILLWIFEPKDGISACVFVVIGCTSAEISAAFVSALLCRKTELKTFGKEPFRLSVCTSVAKTALPLSFSACLRSALSSAENLLIPVSLQKSGMTKSAALSAVGTVKGLVFPLICFPAVFVTAFARLLLPEIGDSRAVGDTVKIRKSTDSVLSFTVVFSLLLAEVFFLFSDDIGMLIYNDAEFFTTLKILSPLIPFMYADCICDSILKGLDMQMTVMKYSITEAALRTAAVLLLIPKIGFYGVIITVYAGNVVNSVMGIIKLKKVKASTLPFTKKIVLSLILFSAILLPLTFIIKKPFMSIFAKISVICAGSTVCAVLAFRTGLISKAEKGEMKKLLLKR